MILWDEKEENLHTFYSSNELTVRKHVTCSRLDFLEIYNLSFHIARRYSHPELKAFLFINSHFMNDI